MQWHHAAIVLIRISDPHLVKVSKPCIRCAFRIPQMIVGSREFSSSRAAVAVKFGSIEHHSSYFHICFHPFWQFSTRLNGYFSISSPFSAPIRIFPVFFSVFHMFFQHFVAEKWCRATTEVPKFDSLGSSQVFDMERGSWGQAVARGKRPPKIASFSWWDVCYQYTRVMVDDFQYGMV